MRTCAPPALPGTRMCSARGACQAKGRPPLQTLLRHQPGGAAHRLAPRKSAKQSLKPALEVTSLCCRQARGNRVLCARPDSAPRTAHAAARGAQRAVAAGGRERPGGARGVARADDGVWAHAAAPVQAPAPAAAGCCLRRRRGRGPVALPARPAAAAGRAARREPLAPRGRRHGAPSRPLPPSGACADSADARVCRLLPLALLPRRAHSSRPPVRSSVCASCGACASLPKPEMWPLCQHAMPAGGHSSDGLYAQPRFTSHAKGVLQSACCA